MSDSQNSHLFGVLGYSPDLGSILVELVNGTSLADSPGDKPQTPPISTVQAQARH